MSEEDGTTPDTTHEDQPPDVESQPYAASEEFTRPITEEEQELDGRYQADRVRYLVERDRLLSDAIGTGVPALTITHTNTDSYDSPMIRRALMAILLVRQPEDPLAKIRVKKPSDTMQSMMPFVQKLALNIIGAIADARTKANAGAQDDSAAPSPEPTKA